MVRVFRVRFGGGGEGLVKATFLARTTWVLAPPRRELCFVVWSKVCRYLSVYNGGLTAKANAFWMVSGQGSLARSPITVLAVCD